MLIQEIAPVITPIIGGEVRATKIDIRDSRTYKEYPEAGMLREAMIYASGFESSAFDPSGPIVNTYFIRGDIDKIAVRLGLNIKNKDDRETLVSAIRVFEMSLGGCKSSSAKIGDYLDSVYPGSFVFEDLLAEEGLRHFPEDHAAAMCMSLNSGLSYVISPANAFNLDFTLPDGPAGQYQRLTQILVGGTRESVMDLLVEYEGGEWEVTKYSPKNNVRQIPDN